MFKPLALYIGLRYTRARKRNHFVSFISLSSMIGIGIGVMVLITVLSVMNGFDSEMRKKFFGMAPEITVTGLNEKLENWQSVAEVLQMTPGVKGLAPYASVQGLLTHEGQVLPIALSGIDPRYEQSVTHLQDKLLAGNLNNLGNFGIILGKGIAESLGVGLNDKVTVMIPEASVTPAGMIPRFKRFTVTGIFSAGNGFNFDSKIAFTNINDAQKLMHLGNEVSGIKLKIDDIYQAPRLAYELSQKLGPEYQLGNWTEQFGAFFHAVKLEKTMMFFILLLIIAVAAFNLVSSLVMVVNDKQAEIAILRTIGSTPKLISFIFIVQGMIVGIIGTLIGLIGGVLLASNATEIVNFIQSLLGIKLFSSNVYFVDELPSKIEFKDLWQVCLAALALSFLATLYPSYRASRTVIAEALHYE